MKILKIALILHGRCPLFGILDPLAGRQDQNSIDFDREVKVFENSIDFAWEVSTF